MNENLEKLDLIDIWRKLNRDKKEYTFFSSKIDHVLGNKKSQIHKGRNNKCNFLRS